MIPSAIKLTAVVWRTLWHVEKTDWADRAGARALPLLDDPHGAGVGAADCGGVGAEGLGDGSGAVGFVGVGAFGFFLRAAGVELGGGEADVDGAVGDVDVEGVAVAHEGDVAACGGFGGDVPDGEAGGAAGEASVGDEGAEFAEVA